MRRVLTLADREEISRGLVQSLEYKEIAVRIGRDPSFAVNPPVAPEGFSFVRRRTRTRMDRMVRGRPGRFGRETMA